MTPSFSCSSCPGNFSLVLFIGAKYIRKDPCAEGLVTGTALPQGTPEPPVPAVPTCRRPVYGNTNTVPMAEQAGQSVFHTTYSQLGLAKPLFSIASPLQLAAGAAARRSERCPQCLQPCTRTRTARGILPAGHKPTRSLRSHPWIIFSKQKKAQRMGVGSSPVAPHTSHARSTRK